LRLRSVGFEPIEICRNFNYACPVNHAPTLAINDTHHSIMHAIQATLMVCKRRNLSLHCFSAAFLFPWLIFILSLS